jgi:hypothetical protein
MLGSFCFVLWTTVDEVMAVCVVIILKYACSLSGSSYRRVLLKKSLSLHKIIKCGVLTLLEGSLSRICNFCR